MIDALEEAELASGRRVLDLCTGSGVVAIAAAELGAASVTAFDICSRAVRCSRRNAHTAGVRVEVHHGPWTRALERGPFQVVVSNPPYVPTPAEAGPTPLAGGPEWSWNGGVDGRMVLDPLCESATRLLCSGGSLLLVQSAFANVPRSLEMLRATGLVAEAVAEQWISFGPVLSARAGWLERTGQLETGCHQEQLVVIRADKP